MRFDLSHLFILFLIAIGIFAMPGLFNFIIVLPAMLIMFCYFFAYRFFFSFNVIYIGIKNTLTVKCLIFFIAFMCMSYLYNFIVDGYQFSHFLYTFFWGYIFNFVFCFFLGILVSFYFKKITLIKIYTSIIMITVIFAMIEFIMYKYNIPGLDTFLALSSGRETVLNYKYEGFPRVQSFFNEPAHFAWFLCCNIPLVYSIANSKYKIFNSTLFDKLVKISIIPLVCLSVIFTQSAIFLIFAIIIATLNLLLRQNLSLKKLMYIVIGFLIALLLIMSLFLVIDISKTYLIRLVNAIGTFGDFYTFTIVEPSLATRIVHWTNMFIIFLHNPIFGVSCGNLNNHFMTQIVYSPLPYTQEILIKDIFTTTPRAVLPSIFFRVIVDTGIIGIVTLYSFLLSIKNIIKKLIHSNKDLTKDFLIGVNYTLITFIFLTFYDSQIYNHYFWLLFGTITGWYIKSFVQSEVTYEK